MHLIQSLKNGICFDLPMFSKYPATSINSYFYKMTLSNFIQSALIMMTLNINPSLHFPFWSDRSSLIVTGPRKTQGSVTDPKQFVNTQYTIYSLEQQNDMFRKLNLILNVKIKQPNWWMLVFFEMDNSTDFWFGCFYGKQHPILHVLVWLLVHITWIYVWSWLLMLSHILSIPINPMNYPDAIFIRNIFAFKQSVSQISGSQIRSHWYFSFIDKVIFQPKFRTENCFKYFQKSVIYFIHVTIGSWIMDNKCIKAY